MGSKITIIGAGSVGSTIAYTLSNERLATEIVMIDINKKKADGEVIKCPAGAFGSTFMHISCGHSYTIASQP